MCVCVRLRQWTHVPMSVGSFAMNCSQSAFLCERPIFKTLVYLFRQFVFLIDSTVCVSCLFLSFTHFKFTCSFFWPYVFLFHRCCHLFSSHFWLNAYEEYRCERYVCCFVAVTSLNRSTSSLFIGNGVRVHTDVLTLRT